jgi:hypothetical protein
MNHKTVWVVLGAVAAGLALFGWQSRTASSSGASLLDASVASIRVRFGVTDRTPRAWDGSVQATSGEIVSIRNWHPRPGDRVDGLQWSFATRTGQNFVRRAWEEEVVTEPVPYLLIPGIVVDVKGTPTLRFQTRNGNFEVSVPQPGASLATLGGAVVIDRVPAAQKLSTGDYQNDFAAVLAGPGDEVWTTWVAYANKQNHVFARRFDGRAWGPAQKVTEQPGDIFLAKIARGPDGVWFIWSDQVKGNWDLYARRFDGRAWSAVERLTQDPQPDVYHNVATDSSGNLWVVWQGFRNGKSDIFARRRDQTGWSTAEQLSTSPANDWEPTLAADSAGRVWVAWDTYDKGNYDIAMRRFENGRWSDLIDVASTPKFEAHVSLACDPQNRVWLAWSEAGMQWGKDSGFLVKKEATRLYQSRWMALAVYANNIWQEPAADIEQSLPEELRGYHDFPMLASDGRRIWLSFRNRTAKFRDVHNNTPGHRAAWEIFATTPDGDRWLTPIQIPFSQGRTDMRAGLASDGRGNLYAAWPTDSRDFDEYLFQHADVYAARMPAPAKLAPPSLQARVRPKLTTFVVHEDEPADLKRIRNYTIESGGSTYRIYRGDTHRHTEFSMDGNNDGTLMQTYRYAMDAAELDYLGVSEHNGMGGPDVDYINWLLQQAADLWMVPKTFTPLYAYERSLNYPNGHRNIIFATRGNPTLPIPPEEQKALIGAKPLYEYLKRYRGIAISHTSATNMGTDWRDNDPAVEPLVEIYQGDRVSAEYEGAPKAAHRANLGSAPGGFRPAGYVWNAWAKGYKLGVQVSSDHLATHTSYACTLSTEFTREGLLDAMRKRHSYGATDNIILDYRLQSGGKEYLQGDIVDVGPEFRLWVKVIGTTPIRQIDIIRNNSFVHNRVPLEKEAAFTFVDPQPPAGESYYYVRVIQADDNMAWSSPIWVRRK